MKIGVRAHDYGRMEIEQLAETLHNCGYQCAQIAMTKVISGIETYGDIKLSHLERLRAAFEKYQLEIPVFGCYMDLANPDEAIRRNAVNNLKMCLAYAKEVGAKTVGTETAYPRLNEEQKKIWYPYMVDAVKEVVEEAVKLDMVFAIEPVRYYPLDSIETVQDVFEKVQEDKHLRIIFDAYNVLKRSDIDNQEAYWTAWMESVGKYIEAMHIKNFVINEQGERAWTTLDQGVIQYDVISKWLRANKPDMYLLREEMDPAFAKEDIAFMKKI